VITTEPASTIVSTTGVLPSPKNVSSAVASDSSVACDSVTLSKRDEDNEFIDPNTCCICFGHYEDDQEGAGAQWIYCKCGTWVHEDCVEETIVNNSGDQRFCTFCVDKFTMTA